MIVLAAVLGAISALALERLVAMWIDTIQRRRRLKSPTYVGPTIYFALEAEPDEIERRLRRWRR